MLTETLEKERRKEAMPKLVDRFPWIELAGRTGDGRMYRNRFVRITDKKAIAELRKRFSNTDSIGDLNIALFS